jgi:hypothetical protein
VGGERQTIEKAYCVQHKGKIVCVYYCHRDLHYIEIVSLANNFHQQHSKLITIWFWLLKIIE